MGLFSKLFGGKSKVKVSENSVKLTDVRCPHCGNTMYTTSQIGKIFGPLLSLGDDDFSRNVFRIQLDVFIGRPCDGCLRRLTPDEWLEAAPWLRAGPFLR